MWAAFKSWKEPRKECVPQRRPDFSQLDFSPTNNKLSISISQFVAVGYKKESEALPDLTPVPQHLVCHTIILTWQPSFHTWVLGSSTSFHLTISYPFWSQPSSSTARTQLTLLPEYPNLKRECFALSSFEKLPDFLFLCTGLILNSPSAKASYLFPSLMILKITNSKLSTSTSVSGTNHTVNKILKEKNMNPQECLLQLWKATDLQGSC